MLLQHFISYRKVTDQPPLVLEPGFQEPIQVLIYPF